MQTDSNSQNKDDTISNQTAVDRYKIVVAAMDADKIDTSKIDTSVFVD